jgi:hypothetical protein
LTENIADVETTQLDSAASDQVERLVQALGFFDLPATVHGDEVGADFFRYEVTINDGARAHTVSFNDDETPATLPLRALVAALSQMR